MDWERIVYYVPSALCGIPLSSTVSLILLVNRICAAVTPNGDLCGKRIEKSAAWYRTFSLDNPRAILARQAAKFTLDAERSIVDSFCQKLTDAIQNIIDRVKAANYKSFGTTQERLWGRFSDVRSSALMVMWNELWLSLGDGTFCKNPLLMQHRNTRAFELAVKLNFPMPGSVILTTSLTNDE